MFFLINNIREHWKSCICQKKKVQQICQQAGVINAPALKSKVSPDYVQYPLKTYLIHSHKNKSPHNLRGFV
jgi:uncharacterized protein YrrD